jgi:hypothetical protein
MKRVGHLGGRKNNNTLTIFDILAAYSCKLMVKAAGASETSVYTYDTTSQTTLIFAKR